MVVDTSAESNLPGLFAAGDCSMVSGGISLAAAMGAIAGRGAAERAKATDGVDVDPRSLEDAITRMEAPLSSEGTWTWTELEDHVRRLVTDHVGLRRTEQGMRRALDELKQLGSNEDKLAADSYHYLMRTLEAKNIRLAAQLMTEAAIHRKESRSGAAHRRIDHPDTDDTSWKKGIVVQRDGAEGISIDYLVEGDSRKPETLGALA